MLRDVSVVVGGPLGEGSDLLALGAWFETAGLRAVDVSVVRAGIRLPRAPQGRGLVDGPMALATVTTSGADVPDLDVGSRHGVVGREGLTVAKTLQQAMRDDIDAVVVLGSGPDAWIAHRYPTQVPVVYADAFDPDDRRHLERHGARWLQIPPGDLEALASGRSPGEADGGWHSGAVAPWAPWTPDEWERRRRAAAGLASMGGASVVAVVDVYDVFRSGLSVLGAGRLPGPDDVRACLDRLGWRSDAPVYATVPDIPDAYLSRLDRMWRVRDAQFLELAREYTEDDDVSTQVNVGRLVVEHHHDGVADAVRMTRIATAVVADAWWAMHRNPDADVVVLSDRWDTVGLQFHAASLGLGGPGRLVRVGLRPLVVAGQTQPVVMLPDDVAGLLLDTPVPVGRRQRRATAAEHRAPSRRWHIVDVLPERDAVVVMAEDTNAVADLGPDEVPPDAESVVLEDFELRFSAPGTVVPRLVDHRAAASAVLEAQVIGRIEPTAVIVDVDGDGIADVMIPTVGDAEALEPGLRLLVSTFEDGRLSYIGPVDDDDDEPEHQPLEPVVVTSDLPGRSVGRRRDGQPVRLRLLRGVAYRRGDHVLAMPLDGDSWTAVSSGLRHLGSARAEDEVAT